MPYTPDRVLEIVERFEPRDPVGTGVRWKAHVETTLDTLFRSFDDVQPTDVDAVAALVRKGSSWLKGRVPTLYVSEHYLTHIEHPERQDALVPDDRGECFEHVVPLEFSLPSKLFLQDPIGALAAPSEPELAAFPWLNRVARALVTPLCYVSKHEDRRLNRLAHSNWARPFQRYADPAILLTAPDAPIIVYRTTDGARIDLDAFTWQEHIATMQAHDVYAPALGHIEEYFTNFAVRRPAMYEKLATHGDGAAWPLGGAAREHSGKYTIEERARLHALLDAAARSGPTIDGMPAMEIPTNRNRLTMTVRHPVDRNKVMVRVNIGPNYAKKELYFNFRMMHAAGAHWMTSVAENVNRMDHPFSLVPQGTDDAKRRGFDIEFDRSDDRKYVDWMADALTVIVAEMDRSYPAQPSLP